MFSFTPTSGYDRDMKYISSEDSLDLPVLELTRRNLTTLLEKLDDPLSHKMLKDGEDNIIVRAVEDDEHYSDRAPGLIFMPTSEMYI